MKTQPIPIEMALLNTVAYTHNRLHAFSLELKRLYPEENIRFEVDMYHADRKQSPGSPLGASWEINRDEQDTFFRFEITYEAVWWISAEWNRVREETLETYFEEEVPNTAHIIETAGYWVERFQQHCVKQLSKERGAF